MPLLIKTNSFKYKDPSTGQYHPIDLVGEQMTFDAEAYGTGKRNGVAVTSGDQAYHNNAVYWKDQAATSATAAAASASQAAASAQVFNVTISDHGINFNTN